MAVAGAAARLYFAATEMVNAPHALYLRRFDILFSIAHCIFEIDELLSVAGGYPQRAGKYRKSMKHLNNKWIIKAAIRSS